MLQVRNISKEYKTGELVQVALNDVSLNLRDNEFVAILGQSGSGKTTLLNIIGGLDRYDDGDLLINGISTKKYTDRDWDTYRNHSIGFVFQSYNLIQHQTVLANVELALTISGISPKERKERATKALEQVGLGDQINKKPNQMSGGQMQRVALARALVNDPDILLADEPTGALDSETSIQVMNLMKEVAKDRLVVMVTHNPELAEEYATRIVRLKDGRIIDDTMPCPDSELFPVEEDGAWTEEEGAFETAASGFDPEEAPAEEIPAGKASGKSNRRTEGQKKHSSMSFLASLSLSFSNLRTKKGRTILTSFAGSIGIIGIALILSLSTGVNAYIDKIQRDTMASYPISISATSFDFASLMGNSSLNSYGQEEETEAEEEKLPVSFRDIETSSAVTTSIKENNLTEFKKYLDDPSSEIHKYIGDNGIVYTYNVDFKVFSYDADHTLIDSDRDLTLEFSDENNILGNLSGARSMMLSNMSAMFGGRTQNAVNFSEMTAGANGDMISALIKDNYDVVYGSWPNNYDEVVLVLNENGTLSSGVLYQLGLITKRQYEAAVRKVEAQEEPDPISLDYPEILKHEFLLMTASDQYVKNPGGTFSFIGSDADKLEAMLADAIHLKIVGLVQEKDDSGVTSLQSAVAYTSKLTDHIIEYSNHSPVVEAQLASPGIDVLSGQAFTGEEPADSVKTSRARDYITEMTPEEKENFYSSLMMVDYEGAIQAMMTTQMGAVTEQISAALQQSIGTAIEGAIAPAIQAMMQNVMEQVIPRMMEQALLAMAQNVQQLAEQAQRQVIEQLIAAFTGEAMQQVAQEILSQVTQEVFAQIQEQVAEQVTPEVREKIAQGILEEILSQVEMANIRKILGQIGEQLPEGLPEELKEVEEAKTYTEMVEMLQKIDFEKLDLSGVDFSKVDFSGPEYSEIDWSQVDFSGLGIEDLVDFSEIDLSGIDFSGIDFSALDLSALDPGNFDLGALDLSQFDFSQFDFSGMDLSGMDLSSMDMSGMDLSGMNLDFGSFESGGGAETSEIVDYWLDNFADQKALIKVYDQFIGVSDYEGNLKKFGQMSYDAPSSISLYADSFEGKDGIAASLKAYNEKATEENKITYTDYVALLTSSITTIINAISYVLIGFVGVSLFVSCIMIGIITNISVLERTKEIGVLRALGASKRNVSNVFNAETFIIGGFSGIIGVGVSLLLTVPINAIVHALMESNVLSAQLPPISAVILILISIVITMIGGLIPANKAAKQDPVVALRTE